MANSKLDPDRVPVRMASWGKPVLRPRWAPFWRRFAWHHGGEGRWLWVGDAMLLLYDATAYKLRSDHVDRIERETGTAAGSLAEGELLAAMSRLGIRELGFTADDKDAIVTTGRVGEGLSAETAPEAQIAAGGISLIR